jgi:F-type H+-transporting ATPase subunit b
MSGMERCRAAVARMGLGVGVVGAALFAASAAWADEAEVHGNPWLPLLWKTINFVLLMAIIWYYGRKPAATFLRGAAQAAQAVLGEPRERVRAAEAELAAQRKRIGDLESELERLLAEAREEARREYERVIAEAHVQAERIKAGVQAQVELEFGKARKELQAELARQTVRLAEEMISRRMDAAAQQRIVTEAIESLGTRP